MFNAKFKSSSSLTGTWDRSQPTAAGAAAVTVATNSECAGSKISVRRSPNLPQLEPPSRVWWSKRREWGWGRVEESP
ncbi:hypothetical protein M0804_012508 [Polistes exclamans]|nr:hypothetical protein M0804_012508 [Polistes exclamans]